ncbi:MAG TPA: cupin domain-containing protein [Ardenticatenaceae bacterium]|nr:cupin domain-containing protein [Ardenticatenaceae bacterium]
MGYSASPRPTFSGPTAIPSQAVTRHLWGDDASGEVADWIYASTDKIHQLVFGLPPGRAFRHSDAYRTIFAADEVLYVLSGTMVISNPETGEVHRVRPGEAAFFRRDTWHHAFNYSTEQLRVLEYFAPPPSQGTSGAYAQTKPYLATPSYTQDQWIGQAATRQSAEGSFTIRVLREADVLWRLEGQEQPALVGILASTEHLTVGTIELLPGQRTDVHAHGGDESLYLLEGTLNVRVPENDGPRWFELNPRDGFYIPQGTPHQYYNVSDRMVKLIFGVAPSYFAPQPA